MINKNTLWNCSASFCQRKVMAAGFNQRHLPEQLECSHYDPQIPLTAQLWNVCYSDVKLPVHGKLKKRRKISYRSESLKLDGSPIFVFIGVI